MQDGVGAELGDGLQHEDAREGGHPGEVAGEEGLVAGEVPRAPGPAALELGDLAQEEEGVPVGQDGLGGPQGRHGAAQASSRAALSFRGVSLGLILYQAWAILPFSSIRNAERMIPM